MQPIADFIQRRCLTDFTGIDQAGLLHAFFYTAYENAVSWGTETAIDQAKSGMLGNLLRSMIFPEKQNDFPWLLVDAELVALGIFLVEEIGAILDGNEIISYNPLPNVDEPKSMMLEIVHEL